MKDEGVSCSFRIFCLTLNFFQFKIKKCFELVIHCFQQSVKALVIHS